MFLYLLLAASCGFTAAANNDGRIIGGENVNIEDYSFQVVISHFYKPVCGGSILNSNFVITAAHCVESVQQWLIGVHVGVNSTSDSSFIKNHHVVKKVIVHPEFNIGEDNIFHDIALIKVTPPIQFSRSVRPITLGNVEPRPHQLVTVSGYGYISEDGRTTGRLAAVSIPVVDKNRCSEVYATFGLGNIGEGKFCAGYAEGGKDSCRGDSGGPAVLNGKLVGIVSYAYRCAQPGIPGVYTSVAPYYRWIYESFAL